MNNQCGKCRHWHPINAGMNLQVGACTARPPVPMPAKIKQGLADVDIVYQSIYPHVEATFPACGEYRDRQQVAEPRTN